MAFWARRDDWTAPPGAETPGKAVLEAALRYRRMGWSVIPVGRNKRPLVPWKRYQTHLATEAQIRQWFTEHPDANVAVIFGAVSGDLACRDFDTLDAWAQFESRHPDLAATLPVVRTGRGYHAYFTAKTRTLRFEGGEVRGEGGYCVTAPSMHASGRRYEWIREPQGPPPTVDPAVFGTPKPAAKRTTRPRKLCPEPAPADIESMPLRQQAAWHSTALTVRMNAARDAGDLAEFNRLIPAFDRVAGFLEDDPDFGPMLRAAQWPELTH